VAAVDMVEADTVAAVEVAVVEEVSPLPILLLLEETGVGRDLVHCTRSTMSPSELNIDPRTTFEYRRPSMTKLHFI